MRKTFTWFSGLMVLATATVARGQATRPQVMIVGTYHMANPGLDMNNIKADDVLAPKRQAEIEALVASLATFRPTVVAVEATPQTDSATGVRFAEYLAGRYSLSRNEADQLGFRLAKGAGLSGVRGINYRKDLDMNAVMKFAGANGFTGFLSLMQAEVPKRMAEAQRQLQTLTVAGIFAQNNGPWMDSTLSMYVRAALIGKDTNYVGAQMASDWYARNLYMLSNIGRLIKGPGDRVIVLVGSGHAPLLREFIRNAGEWELVDPLPLLKKADR